MAVRVISYKRMDGVDASHGQKFEMDMTTLVYLRCLRLHKEWKKEGTSGIISFAVANNVADTGLFDDIVVGMEYVDNGVIKNKLIFVQCKHVENTQKNSKDRFQKYLCDPKELAKYLKSYKEIEESKIPKKEQNNLSSFFTVENLDIEVIFYSNLDMVLNDLESNYFLANGPICKESDIVTEIINSSKSEQYELKLKENNSFGSKPVNQNDESSILKKQFCDRFRIFVNQSEPEPLLNKEIESLTNISDDLDYFRYSLVQEVKLNFTSQKLCFALTESDNLLQNVRNYCDLKREGEAVVKQFRKNYSSMRIFSDEAIGKCQKLLQSQCYNTIRAEYEKLEELKFMQFICTKAEGAMFISINDRNDEENLISARKTRLYENVKQVFIFSKHLVSFEKETLKHSEIVIQLMKHSDQHKMTLEEYMEQFSNETNHYILNKRVCFQGESTDIKALCGESWKMVFDEKSIYDILGNKLLEISTPLQTLDFYVPRTFIKETLNLENYKEMSKTWNINNECIILFSERNDNSAYTSFFNIEEVRKLVQNLVKNDIEEESYHLCSHSNNILQWTYSFGKKSDFTTEYIFGEEDLTNEAKEKLIILSDVAGMGKTKTLLSLARKYKERNRSHWVFVIELNKYIDFFKEVNEFPSTEFAVEFIATTLLNLKETELILFNTASKSGNFALFFDAFDEISPDAEKSFLSLLLALENTNIQNIFVSSRPNFSSSLEEKLLRKSIKFQGLTTEEKELALEGHWRQMLKNDKKEIEDGSLQEIAKKTIKLLQLKEKFLREILANPLQIQMVAFAYYKLLFNNSSEESAPINLAALYEHFINSYAQRFYTEKYQMQWNLTVDKEKRIIEDKLKGAEEIACQLIIPEVLRNDIIDREGEICALCDDVGIITHKSPVVFLHRTVAEYFAAKYLVQKILCKRNNDDMEIVTHFLVEDKFNIVRKFINSLLMETTAYTFGHFHEKKYSFNIFQSLPMTPIHVSASEGNLEISKTLLSSNNAFLNKRNMYGETAMFYACKYGQNETVKLLLTYKDCSVNIRNDDGNTVLHYASSRGDIEIMKLILQHDSSPINMQNKSESTPLHEAYNYLANKKAAKFLLSRSDCSVNIRDSLGNTVLHDASRIGDIEVMQLILQRDSSLLNMQNKSGSTPLHEAIKFRASREAVKFLLSRSDCSVNIRDSVDNTVLHYASRTGDIEIMQLILQRDSSPLNMQNKSGFTPLHEAYNSRAGREAVQFLLSRSDCSVNIRDSVDNTVLHYASCRGDIEIIQLILQHDSSLLNMQNKSASTPLHEACRFGNTEAVKFFPSHKDCSVNIRDIEDNTVLRYASRRGDIEIMQLILERNRSLLNMQNNSGSTPLHEACRFGKTEAVKLFLSHKDCSVNISDGEGDTVLHYASWIGHIEIMQLILQRDRSLLNMQNKSGSTPLHEACYLGKTKTVKLFLAQTDCMVNKRDFSFPRGLTALDVARKKNNTEIIELLLQHGAKSNESKCTCV